MAADDDYEEILADAPSNWGRWGDDDEIGALNVLDAPHVLSALAAATSGKTFTLGLPFADPAGDPVWPDRAQAHRYNVRDRGTYLAGKASAAKGGMEFADDVIVTHLQGTTHMDALAHTWYGGRVYNGYSASSTAGALDKASVEPIGRHGVVGRGVLIDLPRARGVDNLGSHDPFTLAEIRETADRQGVQITTGDILLVRTGWIEVFYRDGPEKYYGTPYHEPGLLFEPEVPQWFREHDIVAYGTDTAGNEFTVQPGTGLDSPLHASLMRNLGVNFMELLWLADLAADCDADHQYDFVFAAAPLRVIGGTGGPMNPLAIK